MKIFCFGREREIDRVDRCPLCESVGEVGFEADREWHFLARLWAGRRGYWGDRETVSLPLWFEKHPDQLAEWKAFKAKLLDVTAIPLPENLKGRYWESYEFWINSSGILPLQQGTLKDLIITRPVGPLVHELAVNFANYHKAQWEAEEKVKAEEKAKEEQERLKGKKKPHLIQRIKGERRRRNHERV